MKRSKFLHSVSGGLAAVCVSCLAAACSKDEAPSPVSSTSPITNPAPNPGSNAFTVKLDSELRAVNDFISKNGIILIRIAAGNIASSFLLFPQFVLMQVQPLITTIPNRRFHVQLMDQSLVQMGLWFLVRRLKDLRNWSLKFQERR